MATDLAASVAESAKIDPSNDDELPVRCHQDVGRDGAMKPRTIRSLDGRESRLSHGLSKSLIARYALVAVPSLAHTRHDQPGPSETVKGAVVPHVMVASRRGAVRTSPSIQTTFPAPSVPTRAVAAESTAPAISRTVRSRYPSSKSSTRPRRRRPLPSAPCPSSCISRTRHSTPHQDRAPEVRSVPP